MSSSKFFLSKEEFQAQYAENGILKNGLVMNSMDGIWLAWETDPEAVQELLPPALGFAAPIAMSYIINANTEFAGVYHEAALILPCQHEGVPGAFLQSMLVEGPGAPQAEYLGREMAGMPKKICDEVFVEYDEKTAHAHIVKDGIKFLDATLELGEYNTPAGNEIFGANASTEPTHGGLTYLIKYNLEQADDGHMYFANGRLLTTESDTLYTSWTPATAQITLTDCPNAPWASLPVKQVLAAGAGAYSMCNFVTNKVCDIDAEQNARYLLPARFDRKLFI